MCDRSGLWEEGSRVSAAHHGWGSLLSGAQQKWKLQGGQMGNRGTNLGEMSVRITRNRKPAFSNGRNHSALWNWRNKNTWKEKSQVILVLLLVVVLLVGWGGGFEMRNISSLIKGAVWTENFRRGVRSGLWCGGLKARCSLDSQLTAGDWAN